MALPWLKKNKEKKQEPLETFLNGAVHEAPLLIANNKWVNCYSWELIYKDIISIQKY